MTKPITVQTNSDDYVVEVLFDGSVIKTIGYRNCSRRAAELSAQAFAEGLGLSQVKVSPAVPEDQLPPVRLVEVADPAVVNKVVYGTLWGISDELQASANLMERKASPDDSEGLTEKLNGLRHCVRVLRERALTFR